MYDTDGNFLQRLDTLEMRLLIPRFLDLVISRFHTTTPFKLVDLGCGTGRNTIPLLEALSTRKANDEASGLGQVEIIGLDASLGMLDVARKTIESAMKERDLASDRVISVSLGTLDLLQGAAASGQLPSSLQDSGAVGVISTLVLEHIPSKEFFEAASATMVSGGCLLVTNMHAEMGDISQAGFTDSQTGVKIRPTSYCHSVSGVVKAAEEVGFQLVDISGEDGDGVVLERGVDEQLAEKLGTRAKKWIGVKVWFGMCFCKMV